jgi:hypothetical protein
LGPWSLVSGRFAERLQALAKGFQFGGEQVAAGVERDARGLVAELLLTALTLAPWAISREAQVWRRSYRRNPSGSSTGRWSRGSFARASLAARMAGLKADGICHVYEVTGRLVPSRERTRPQGVGKVAG